MQIMRWKQRINLIREESEAGEEMKRGKLEPREVNDQLTPNEEKVLLSWGTPKKNGEYKSVKDIAEETGFTTQTTLRHLATLELWAGTYEVKHEAKD